MPTAFSLKVVEVISHIPHRKVLTYGSIAALAGKPQAARQVAWILHCWTEKYDLPWWRVVNRQGKISLRGRDYLLQKALMQKEKIDFGVDDKIDLGKYLWAINSFREPD